MFLNSLSSGCFIFVSSLPSHKLGYLIFVNLLASHIYLYWYCFLYLLKIKFLNLFCLFLENIIWCDSSERVSDRVLTEFSANLSFFICLSNQNILDIFLILCILSFKVSASDCNLFGRIYVYTVIRQRVGTLGPRVQSPHGDAGVLLTYLM